MGCERVVVGWGSGVKGWWWCGVGCMVTGGGVGWGVKGWWWCGVGREGVVAGWGGACRPPNSHSFGVRLTLLGQISLSHSNAFISHSSASISHSAWLISHFFHTVSLLRSELG